MKKIMKTFGIGAAVLMILLAAAPAVYGAPSRTVEQQTMDLPEGVKEAIQKVAKENPEKFEELLVVVQGYLKENGNLDGLKLSSDLMELLAPIINALQEDANNGGTLPPCMMPWWKWAIIIVCVAIMVILWI